jgi:methyl-accepting chemotaxis protein
VCRATEVRRLAGRSADAARQIKQLIEDGVQRVAEGSRLVDESGATLAQLVSSVGKVNDIVAEIATASHEQAPASTRSARP